MQATTKQAAIAAASAHEDCEEPQVDHPEAPGQREPSAALAPIEEPILEGEVTAILEPEKNPIPTRPPSSLLVVATVLVCLGYLAGSLLMPLFTPSATVIILPNQRHLATTAIIEVSGRVLPSFTLSRSQTVPATGHLHLDATYAAGRITLYNGLVSPQTIAAGTIVTGRDGVQIITNGAALIPPARNTTPPTFGHVTIAAQTLIRGSRGNIAAYDVNGACCAPSVLVKNTTAFTGGQNQRDETIVSRADTETAATVIETTLLKSVHAVFQAQGDPGEAFLLLPCTQEIHSTHQAGDEAREVTVTVSETCSGIGYATHAFQQQVTQMITKDALDHFGTGYSLMSEVRMQVVRTTITDPKRGIATLTLKLEATYCYQFRPGERAHLSTFLAGKPKQQAISILLQLPGIQAASIDLSGGNASLPDNPNNIHIIVMYQTS